MISFPVCCKTTLAELAKKVNSDPPESASASVCDAGILLMLAGYGQYAYQAFSSLLNDELAINSASALVHQYENIFLSLCHGLGIPSPNLPKQNAMTFSELSKAIEKR